MSPKKIQNSVQSTAKNSKASGPSVLKWKKAGCVQDKRSGSEQPKHFICNRSKRLCVNSDAFLSFLLNNVYSALKEKIPNFMGSNLHRCLKRLNILPKKRVGP
ncbi:hypothetical protein [Holospora obtusa]|uniref:hypothetical protein n=1 Tax=Holospora obtusa TaxID=49893 RepID=UPI0003AE9098|nr:hypothetical protein [Holospora obtusa]